MNNIKNITLKLTDLSQASGKILLTIVLGLMLIFGLLAYNHSQNLVHADAAASICEGINYTSGDPAHQKCDDNDGLSKTLNTGINIFTIIIGSVAVIMIIYAGFRYIVSGGSSEGVKGARNTLIYAIVGLIVVLLAQTVVKYVLTEVTGGSDSSGDSTSNDDATSSLINTLL